MTPIISIIMPVYNAEETVGRMIDTIINQTYTNWELIAVNDGSNDHSKEILDMYEQNNSRIKVVHKDNGGVASARQTGIEKAKGKYIIHADSDDWVETSMLEEMYNKAIEENADMIIADYYTEDNKGNLKYINQKQSSFCTEDLLYNLYIGKLFGGLCHKLIKKEIFDKVNFSKGINYCEDHLLLTKILKNKNLKIVHLPKAFYHYIQNNNSLTRKVSLNGLESMRMFHQEALKLLENDERFSFLEEDFKVKEFYVIFINKLYKNKGDLKKLYKKIKPFLNWNNIGLRWKLGYKCIDLGLVRMAHNLIKF